MLTRCQIQREIALHNVGETFSSRQSIAFGGGLRLAQSKCSQRTCRRYTILVESIVKNHKKATDSRITHESRIASVTFVLIFYFSLLLFFLSHEARYLRFRKLFNSSMRRRQLRSFVRKCYIVMIFRKSGSDDGSGRYFRASSVGSMIFRLSYRLR